MARSQFRSQGTANSNVIHLFERNKEPESKLWLNVLSKALDDALYSSDHNSAERAISWVMNHGKDFKLVCHYAGRNWHYVYHKVIKQVLERENKFKSLRKRAFDNGIRR